MSDVQKTPIQHIYEGLAAKNPDLKEYGFDAFANDMKDENNLKSLYSGLAEKNPTLKETGFDSFKSDIWGDQPDTQKEQKPDPIASLHSSIPYVYVDENNQDNNQIVQSLPESKQDVSYNENNLPKIGQEGFVDNVIPRQKSQQEQYFDQAQQNTGGARINSNQPEESLFFSSPEEEKIDLAQNILDRSKRQINAVTGQGDNTGVGDALRDRNFWTLGASDLSSMIYLKKIAGKLEDGTPLTEGDKALLEAWNQSEQVNQQYPSSDANIWYKTGKNVTDMIPWLVQFAATRRTGSAVPKGIQSTLKQNAEKYLGKTIASGLSKGIAEVAGAYAAAAFMPNTYADITRRTLGQTYQDEQGNIKFDVSEADSNAKAIYKGWTNSMLEVLTERLGEGITEGIKYLPKNKFTSLLTSEAKGKTGKAISDFTKAVGWNGAPIEYLEEWVNVPLNALLVGDNKYSDIFDGKQQLETLLTVAAMGTVIGSAKYAANKYDSYRSAKNYKSAKSLFDNEIDDETRNMVESIINSNQSISEISDKLDQIFTNVSGEEAGIIMNYVVNSIKNTGSQQPTGPVSSDSAPQFTISPRQQAEFDLRSTASQFADNETGLLQTIHEVTPDGQENRIWLIKAGQTTDPDGSILVEDEAGNSKFLTKEQIAGKPNNMTIDDFVNMKLSEYDQTKQNQELLKQYQIQIDGKRYILTGDKTNEGLIALNTDDGSETVVPFNVVDKIKGSGTSNANIIQRAYGKTNVTGIKNDDGSITLTDNYDLDKANSLKEEIEKSTGGKATIQAELIPNEDSTLPDSYQLSIIPVQSNIDTSTENAQEINQNDTTPPSQDNNVSTEQQVQPEQPKYTLNGNEIDQTTAKARVRAAILKGSADKLTGLEISNDPELSGMIEKAFPKPKAKFTLGKKTISPEDAMDWIIAADNFNELNELKAENIDSEPAVAEAFRAKVKYFTPTQREVENSGNIENANQEKVSENQNQQTEQHQIVNQEQSESSQKNQLQNEESENVNREVAGTAQQTENTPQEEQGQGVNEGLEENVNIEAKKADIEKRRKEDLETTKNIGEDKLIEGRKNTKKIFESLKQRYSPTSVKGIIIRLLEKLIDISKYSTIIDTEYLDKRNASGQATWFGMLISDEVFDGIISGKDFDVHTFIHELMHGFTTSKISDYNIMKNKLIDNWKTELTPKEIKAIEQLERIFAKVKKALPNSKEYGLTNIDEFIAEAFSNESFQYTLKSIESEGKKSNLFKDFVNAISDILYEQLERWSKRFGREIPNKSTVTGILEDVFAWAEDLIDQNNKIAYLGTNDEINAKYDAELAALENTNKNTVPPVATISQTPEDSAPLIDETSKTETPVNTEEVSTEENIPDVSLESDQVQDVAGQDSGQRPAVKEPWEMTRDEYIDSLAMQMVKDLNDGKDNVVKNNFVGEGKPYHREVVKQALSEGKPVPEEVLNDYPELKKEQALPRDVTGNVPKSPLSKVLEEGKKEVQKKKQESPLTKQYNEIKAKYPDALVVFKVDDFYEMMGVDAENASKALGIVLTKTKDGKSLAGFQSNMIDEYLPKLVKAGFQVAIAEDQSQPIKEVKRNKQSTPLPKEPKKPLMDVLKEGKEVVEEKKQAKIETDPRERQRLENGIAEGEMILKSGKTNSGRKMSSEELQVVKRSVDNAKAKLGIELDNNVSFRRLSNQEENNLIAVHNIKPAGLLNANRLGGLPMPSIAIVDVNNGFDKYGDITLIADKDFIDPKKNRYSKVFASDVYSARYPNLNYVIPAKGNNVLIKKVESVLPLPISSDVTHRIKSAIIEGGVRDLARSEYAQLLFLADTKRPIEIKYSEPKFPESIKKAFIDNGWKNLEYYEINDNNEVKKQLTDLYAESIPAKQRKESMRFLSEDGILNSNIMRNFMRDVQNDIRDAGKVDNYATVRAASEYIQKNNLQDEFEAYAANLYDQIGVEEKIFRGFSNSGNRMYSPHTLENVLKEMKKDGIRGGEKSGYGAGSVRAQVTPEFKSLSDIQKNRGQIMPFEDDIKSAANDELMEVMNNLKKFYKYESGSFGYYDNASDELVQLARFGRSESFKPIDEESRKMIADFLNKLTNLPTEYFEAKINRGVSLAEFKNALIPSNTSPEIRDILKFNGINIIEYKDNADRAEKLKQLANEKDLRFRIIGEAGAANLDKAEEATTRLDNLAIAREMEQAGKDVKSIRLATGWEKSVDGLWRYEVPDVKISQKGYRKLWDYINKNTTLYLYDIIESNHTLFDEYPEIFDTKVYFDNIEEGIAHYDPNNDAIVFSKKHFKQDPSFHDSNIESTLIHEIQHNIQEIEGFAKGGSAKVFSTNQLYQKAKQLNLLGKGLTDEEINYKVYKAIAGEVESRNVQSRMNMTPEERLNTLLSETEDVAREDQIVLMDGLGVSNLEGEFEYTDHQSLIDKLESEATENDEVILDDNEGLALQLAGKISDKDLFEIRNSGRDLGGFEIFGKVYINSIISPMEVVKTWIHEKTHRQLKRIFPQKARREQFLNKVFDHVGEREINATLPKIYHGDSREQRAEEYIVFKVQEYGMTGNVNADPEIKKIIFELLNRFTTLKNIQDATHGINLAQQRSGKRNTYDGLRGRSGLQENGRIGGKGEPNFNRGLRQNEGREGTEASRIAELALKSKNNPSVFSEYLSEAKKVVSEKQSQPENTILIDGKLRSTVNSKGLPIAQTEEGIRNFYRWFGDSKVAVNDRPLVVYHGTTKNFDVFKSSKFSTAGYFAEDPKFSNRFAEGAMGYMNGSPSILPVYLSLQNPIDLTNIKDGYVDISPKEFIELLPFEVSDDLKSTIYGFFKGTEQPLFSYLGQSKFTDYLKSQGFDGVIFNETAPESFNEFTEDKITSGKAYIAFDANQIKSATGNNGSFDPDNNDIRYRRGEVPLNDYLEEAARQNQEAKKTRRNLSEVAEGVREFIQDHDLPIRRLEEKVKQLGGKIADNMKPYRDMSLSYGRMETLYKKFTKDKFEPIIKTISKIVKSGTPAGEVLPYVICKHALERNPYMRAIELKEWQDNAEIELKKWTDANIDIPQATKDRKVKEFTDALEAKKQELSKKDYSGVRGFDPSNNFETPDELAQEIVDEFERKTPIGLVDELWSNVKNATSEIVDIWGKGQTMSEEQVQQTKDRFKYFVPLRGWRHGVAKQLVYKKGEGFSGSLQRIKGRTSIAENPLAYIEQTAFKALGEQVDNEVKTSLLNLVVGNYSDDFQQLYRLKKAYYIKDGIDENGEQMWKLTTERPSEELFKSGDAVTKIYNQYQKLRTPSQAHEHEVYVKRPNGDLVVVMVGENLPVAQAMNKKNTMYRSVFGNEIHDADDLNRIATFDLGFGIIPKFTMGGLNNFLKGMYTAYNIVFPITNFMRDAQEASITQFIKGDNGHLVVKNYKNAFPAIIRSLRGKESGGKYDEMLKEFRETGGNTGYTHLKTPEQLEKEINSELEMLNRTGTFRGYNIDNARKALSAIEAWNQIFEDATRFSVYITSREAGKSAKEAANDSKEASVNFNRKGKSSKAFDSVWAFWNVAIQSMQKNFKLAKDHKGKFGMVAGAWLALGFLEAMMNDAMGGDDDKDYYNISDYVRENYLIVPILFGDKKDKYLRIPLPQFWRGFKSAGSIAYDVMNGKMDGLSATAKGLGNFLGGLLPIDIGGFYQNGEFSMAPVIPTIIRPVYEVKANRDYMGYTIAKEPFTKEQERSLAASGLGKDNVSPAIKFFTDYLFRAGGGDNETRFYTQNGDIKKVPGIFDYNPSYIEHLITGYTGGTGKFVTDVLTTAIDGLDSEKEVDFRNAPFINQFIKKIPEAKWKVIGEYYDIKSEGNESAFGQLKRSYFYQEDKTKYKEVAGSNYLNEYNAVVNAYDKRLTTMMQYMDYKTAEGSEEVINTMKDAIEAIKQVKQKYNKK